MEAVTPGGEPAAVYNLRVAEHHTYFVGSREWGFSVWAHNTCLITRNRLAGNAFRDSIAATLQDAGYAVRTEEYVWTPLGKRFLDIVLRQNGAVVGAIEAKVGGSAYKAIQRLKDAWIRVHYGWGVTVVRG